MIKVGSYVRIHMPGDIFHGATGHVVRGSGGVQPQWTVTVDEQTDDPTSATFSTEELEELPDVGLPESLAETVPWTEYTTSKGRKAFKAHSNGLHLGVVERKRYWRWAVGSLQGQQIVADIEASGMCETAEMAKWTAEQMLWYKLKQRDDSHSGIAVPESLADQLLESHVLVESDKGDVLIQIIAAANTPARAAAISRHLNPSWRDLRQMAQALDMDHLFKSKPKRPLPIPSNLTLPD